VLLVLGVCESVGRVAEQLEAGSPLAVEIDAPAACPGLGVGAGGEQHAENADHDDLRDGVVRGHVALVKQLHWVAALLVEARALRLRHQRLRVLLQVLEVLKRAAAGRSDAAFDGRLAEEVAQVDLEENQELAHGHRVDLETVLDA